MYPGRDQNAIKTRILEQMDKAGLDALILTAPHDIFYATGHCSRNVYRSGRVGASAAVVNKSGKVGLVISEFEKAVAEKADVITGYVVKESGLQKFEVTLGELTDDEREIILQGCLINYNRR